MTRSLVQKIIEYDGKNIENKIFAEVAINPI